MLSIRIHKFVLVLPRRVLAFNHTSHLRAIQQRCISIFSGSDTIDLHKLLATKDPQLLIQYIKKDWSDLSTKTNTGANYEPKITSIITSLYVFNTKGSQSTGGNKLDSAFSLIEVIYKEDSNNLYSAYLDFLDFSIENNLLDEAMKCVSKIKGFRRIILSPLADQLTRKLAAECRIDDISTVMDSQDVSAVMLTTTAEPLLLSGLHHDYLKYLRKFLDPNNSNNSSNKRTKKYNENDAKKSLPHPRQVEMILQAIVIARLRISLSSAGETELDYHFLLQLSDCITDYHREYLQDPSCNNNEYPDSKSLPTYKLLQRLRYDDGRKQIFDDMQRSVMGVRMLMPHTRQYKSRQITSAFEFLSEDKIKYDLFQFKVQKRSRRRHLEVRDLTMDISRRRRSDSFSGLFAAAERPLLYSGALFPGDLEREMEDVKGAVNQWGDLHLAFGSPHKMESDMNVWRSSSSSSGGGGGGDDELGGDDDSDEDREDVYDIDDEDDEYSLDDDEDDDDDEHYDAQGMDDGEEDELDDRSDSIDSNASVNGDDRYYDDFDDDNTPIQVEFRLDDIDRSNESETMFNELLETVGHGIYGGEADDETNLSMKDITRAMRVSRYSRELQFSEEFFSGSSDTDRSGDAHHLNRLLAGSGSGSGMNGGRGGGRGGAGAGGGALQTKNIFPSDDAEKGDDDDSGLASGQGAVEVEAVEVGAAAIPAENSDQKEE